MKTITQYKEDIKNLMKAVADINAKAVNENRELNPEEVELKNRMMDKVKTIDDIVKSLEEEERLKAYFETPQPRKVPPAKSSGIEVIRDERDKDRFGSFGEFLMNVKNAGTPGGHVDPRLYMAATGLNETVPSDGGFLVQKDHQTELLQEVFETGILASKVRRRIQISGSSNGTTINGIDETSRASSRAGGIIAYWADEAAEKTASKPKFRQIDLKLKKLIALCYATDESLSDASVLESTIRTEFPKEMGFQVDSAIYSGTGAGSPLGFMNSGSLVTVSKEAGQGAATIMTENIVKMFARRFASQTANYLWLYNQDIEPQLLTLNMQVGLGGTPVYMPPGGLADAPYGRILGRPALACEHSETLGTTGDIALVNIADGYVTAEKGGIKTDVSIHVRFIYDESVFRFVFRLDGQPIRATALTPHKGSNTQSHFIVLETRS